MSFVPQDIDNCDFDANEITEDDRIHFPFGTGVKVENTKTLAELSQLVDVVDRAIDGNKSADSADVVVGRFRSPRSRLDDTDRWGR